MKNANALERFQLTMFQPPRPRAPWSAAVSFKQHLPPSSDIHPSNSHYYRHTTALNH